MNFSFEVNISVSSWNCHRCRFVTFPRFSKLVKASSQWPIGITLFALAINPLLREWLTSNLLLFFSFFSLSLVTCFHASNAYRVCASFLMRFDFTFGSLVYAILSDGNWFVARHHFHDVVRFTRTHAWLKRVRIFIASKLRSRTGPVAKFCRDTRFHYNSRNKRSWTWF